MLSAPTTLAAPAPPLATTPASLVAAQPSQLVVLDSSDGRVQRVSAELPYDPILGADALATPADRSVAYLSGANIYAPIDCGEHEDPQVIETHVHVDLATGAVTTLGTGRAPVVTSDGTRLAYVSQQCGHPEALVVRDLATQAAHSWSVPRKWRNRFWVPSAWDRDGRHLVVQLARPGNGGGDAGRNEVWIVDTHARGRAVKARTLPARGRFDKPLEILPIGATGRWVAIAARPGHHPDLIVEYDLAQHTFGHVLLKLRGFGSATTPHLLDVDTTGRSILFSFFLEVVGGTGLSVWRWTDGEREPTKIAANTHAARWLEKPDAGLTAGP